MRRPSRGRQRGGFGGRRTSHALCSPSCAPQTLLSSLTMDKLGMSLDDMIKSGPATGKGKGRGGGGGGAIKGRGSGKAARAAAAPYQKPTKGGKGKGGKGGGIADMLAAATSPAAATKPGFVLTTGTTLRVGNLDFGVSAEDVEGESPRHLHTHIRHPPAGCLHSADGMCSFACLRLLRALCGDRAAQDMLASQQARWFKQGLRSRHLQAQGGC